MAVYSVKESRALCNCMIVSSLTLLARLFLALTVNLTTCLYLGTFTTRTAHSVGRGWRFLLHQADRKALTFLSTSAASSPVLIDFGCSP